MEVRASQMTFLLGPKKKITLILGKFPELISRNTSNHRIIKSAQLKKHSGWTTGHTFRPYKLHAAAPAVLRANNSVQRIDSVATTIGILLKKSVCD